MSEGTTDKMDTLEQAHWAADKIAARDSEIAALKDDNTRLREALEDLLSAVSDCLVPSEFPRQSAAGTTEVIARRQDLVALNEQYARARAALSPAAEPKDGH